VKVAATRAGESSSDPMQSDNGRRPPVHKNGKAR
jgi:hypothetical protein